MHDDQPEGPESGFAETVATENTSGDADTVAVGSVGELDATRDAALEATVACGVSGDESAVQASGLVTPAPGDALGRYLVERPLGAGGMGVVYCALDPDLQRQVALKLLSPRESGGAAGDDSARTRLMREAQAMAQLSHPNILTVYDVGVWGDQVYIAMELVKGVTLDVWLRDEPRSIGDVLDVFVQAANGLQAAHKAGLVHRDFKPENVLVDKQGRVRVMDFGLARLSTAPVADEDSAVAKERSEAAESDADGPSGRALHVRLTQAGALLGTPAYMSPEQYTGAPVDARSDQFSYAVAFYEALYEQRPFRGKTLGELQEAVTTGRVEAPPRERKVPAWARQILLRALSVEPGDRFASLEAMMVTLQRLRRRRRWIVWGSVVLVILALAVGVIALVQRRASKRHSQTKARLEQQARDRKRLKGHLNGLRAKREEVLRKLVAEKDAQKRAHLVCQIAGLEDIIKKPGARITAREIRRAMKHCLPVLEQCYLTAQKIHPRAAGTISLEFLTDRNGKVTRLRVSLDTVGIKSLTRCVKAVFANWHFPTGGGDIEPIHMTYPFRFAPPPSR